MARFLWFYPCLPFLLLTPHANGDVIALSSSLYNPSVAIQSGTITFSGHPRRAGDIPDGYLPEFNLTTDIGTLTGHSSAVTNLMYQFNQSSARTADPSFTFITPINGLICCTAFVFSTPELFYVVSDGACCGEALGGVTASPINVHPGGPGTFVVPFVFSAEFRDFGVDVTSFGWGNANVQFDTSGNQVNFVSATYTFDAVPEPGTGSMCTLVVLCGSIIAGLRYSRRGVLGGGRS